MNIGIEVFALLASGFGLGFSPPSLFSHQAG
jgi:hypothetical protein